MERVQWGTGTQRMEDEMATALTEFFRRDGSVLDPFEEMRREMMHMFPGRWADMPSLFKGGFVPVLDVRMKDDGLEVTAELPGVTEDDISLEINDDILTLSGEKKSEYKEKTEKGAVLMERSFGSFSRSVRLPFAPDPEKVKAAFKDGVLTVTAPKPEELAKRSRRIAITH
ncbi:MAG: Hsp20/alpha crystallin family protein [Alphaproteobacteria bacterium]|nr:MAG: Hsp20/alpha crystallin family protein [Alphaproteobacteria bacterium]